MNISLSTSHCFLCGSKLIKATDEHIFPKWLQHKFELWNETITLLNGSKIPYRMLKIPCCNKCNNEYLSEIEKEVSDAVNNGYESFVSLDEDKIFYWASKILYGLLFKELSLNKDRKDPNAGKIMTAESMERFSTLHILLQGIRIPTKFLDIKPYSIFIFKMYEYENGDRRNFNYFDSYNQNIYGMKMNDIGFIMCIEDSGVHGELGKSSFGKYKDKVLHEIQLQEIFAQINYKQYLALYPPRYMVIESESQNERSIQVIQPSGNLFDEWSQEIYGHILTRILARVVGPENIKFEDIYSPPDKVMTFLNNEDGSFKEIPKYM